MIRSDVELTLLMCWSKLFPPGLMTTPGLTTIVPYRELPGTEHESRPPTLKNSTVDHGGDGNKYFCFKAYLGYLVERLENIELLGSLWALPLKTQKKSSYYLH